MTSKDRLFDREHPLRQVFDGAAGFGERPRASDLALLTTSRAQQRAIAEIADQVADLQQAGNLATARRWAAESAASFAETHGELRAPEQRDERTTDQIVDAIRHQGDSGYRPTEGRSQQ